MASVVFPRRTELHRAALAASTLDKYTRATRKFIQWCRENGEDARTVPELDELLNEYTHHCWEFGGNKSNAVNALWGTIHFLFGVHSYQFPMTLRCLKGWNKLQPSQPWAPLTWEQACVIAVHFTLRGRFDMAVGCLLAFDCLLRNGEMTHLHVADIAFESDPRIGSSFPDVGLRLRKTKGGPNQYTKLRRPEVKDLLREWISTRHGSMLFDFTSDDFRRVFRAICNDLGFSNMYVPHSLRHGGATDLWLLTRDLDRVMIAGRWKSKRSARHYIQDCCALLMALSILPSVTSAGKAFASDIRRALALAVARSGGGGL